jgi:hypothetical protein
MPTKVRGYYNLAAGDSGEYAFEIPSSVNRLDVQVFFKDILDNEDSVRVYKRKLDSDEKETQEPSD